MNRRSRGESSQMGGFEHPLRQLREFDADWRDRYRSPCSRIAGWMRRSPNPRRVMKDTGRSLDLLGWAPTAAAPKYSPNIAAMARYRTGNARTPSLLVSELGTVSARPRSVDDWRGWIPHVPTPPFPRRDLVHPALKERCQQPGSHRAGQEHKSVRGERRALFELARGMLPLPDAGRRRDYAAFISVRVRAGTSVLKPFRTTCGRDGFVDPRPPDV